MAATLEETLWAHYNFANDLNIASNVRKNELQNLFEIRAESLQSQEDLAKRWEEMGNSNRKKLIEQLKERAKEIKHDPFNEYMPEDIGIKYTTQYHEELVSVLNQQALYGGKYNFYTF